MRNPFESHSSWSPSQWSGRWSRLPATTGVVVSTALLAGLTYAIWRAVRSSHVARRGTQPVRQPEDLTRWEGEGGGVPMGAGSNRVPAYEASPAGGTTATPRSSTGTPETSRASGLGSAPSGGLPH